MCTRCVLFCSVVSYYYCIYNYFIAGAINRSGITRDPRQEMANLRSGSHQLSRVSERSADEYNNDLPQRSMSHNHVDLPQQKSRFSLDNIKGESSRRDNRYSDDDEEYDDYNDDERPQRRKNPPQASSNIFANYKIEDDLRQIARHRSYVERDEPRSLQESYKQRRKTDPTDEEDGDGSYNDSSMPGNEDIMPITRPSAPTRNNRRVNGRRANRSSAFDVDSTRASLIASLKSSAVLEQKQKQEEEQKRLTSRQQQDADISASLMCRIKGSGGDISASIIHRLQEDDSGNRKKKSSQPSTIQESSKGEKKNKSSSKKSSTFRTSLIESLCDMGFHENDIEMAIEKTNAKTSSDTAKVVEWLGEHEGECKTVDIGHNNESDEEKEDEETLYTKRTQASAGTNNTNQTTETEESDERVKELGDSLRDLGFAKADIKRNKDLYRRHSDKMDAQSFIEAMLEVEDEVPMNPAEDSTKKASSTSSAGKKTNTKTVLDESERSMDLGELEHQKLIDSISEMGFGKDQIKKVIDDLNDAGARKIDADGVLAKLLNGGGAGSSPNRSASEGNSSKFSQSCSSIGNSSKNRHSVSTSKPTDHHKETDTSIGSIEITPGQFAKLLKGRLTWNAMHNGTAVAASCIICTSTLQCCPEADYVLCPDCNVVSPIDDDDDKRSRNNRGSNVGSVGLGYKKG